MARRLAQMTLATMACWGAPSAAQAQLPVVAPALPVIIRPEFLARGLQEVVRVNEDGHFYFEAQVNGASLRMLFDTGATSVALRAEDAPRLGIDPSRLDYHLSMHTANGTGRAAPVTLATLTIGGITRRDVAAIVVRPGQLSENLLGQSFLARLPGYRQNGNRLVLLDRE